ncbi:MAG TPA: PIN domain-containing protein [Solirubrobacteraceae bacterium]|nr:PIN domain-containing protein [Solirubrobacteraceae bacterium]
MTRGLVDSSAWIRAQRTGGDLGRLTDEALRTGDLAICEPVRIELLRGARSGPHATAIDEELSAVITLTTDADAWRLARRTIVQLAHLHGGRHRGPSLTDIVVAATAERHGVAVLHDDADFELIASVTGQPVARIAG